MLGVLFRLVRINNVIVSPANRIVFRDPPASQASPVHFAMSANRRVDDFGDGLTWGSGRQSMRTGKM